MPLQNRVDPKGSLIAVNARGAWMGNRGILHNDQQQIVSPWKHKAWVTCQLAFKGRQRKIFSPGDYSELFFLDEATALSAGHRPCAECRRERFNEFKTAWLKANAAANAQPPLKEIDKQLHAERAIRGGGKVTYSDEFRNLPPGTFIEYNDQACLIWAGRLWQWSPEGYVDTGTAPVANEEVKVFTPRSIVAMYTNGFTPEVAKSAPKSSVPAQVPD